MHKLKTNEAACTQAARGSIPMGFFNPVTSPHLTHCPLRSHPLLGLYYPVVKVKYRIIESTISKYMQFICVVVAITKNSWNMSKMTKRYK